MTEIRVSFNGWENNRFSDMIFFFTIESAIINHLFGDSVFNFIETSIVGESEHIRHNRLRGNIFKNQLNMSTTIGTHVMFTSGSSLRRDFLEILLTKCHGIDFTVRENTESIGSVNIFS